jgi:hypothetical protein
MEDYHNAGIEQGEILGCNSGIFRIRVLQDGYTPPYLQDCSGYDRQHDRNDSLHTSFRQSPFHIVA